nr:MAG TPA: Neck appendage protein [Caudoviricetes sp.]
MLYLLESDTRNVKWNGIPLHEATSAIIKEQMNGDFTLTLRYPITDSEIYQLFREDMLIKAPAPVIGPQLFRIKKPVENDDHLEITAYHITDDVMQRSINPLSVNKQSCWQALSQLVQVAKSPINDFSFTSDITDRRTINTKEVETLYSVLMDGAHSIVGTWEGEMVRDNFAISIKRNRGEDRGVIISTHKNLKSYQRTKNSQNIVTRIHAKSTFKAEGAKEDTTIAITVDSPLIGAYPYINERSYTNNNIQTVEELTKWASAKFTNEHIDKATDAIKIEAYELDGQTVHMGDIVNLKSYKHNVDVYKKAIAYEYDCLGNNGQGAYLTIIFDDKVKSGGNGGGVSAVANAILDKQETQFDIMLEHAIANADRAFDAEFAKREKDITDAIELAKAKAEEVKQELSDTINQRFNSFDNGPLKEVKRKAEEALKNAGASSSLAQEAKQIGLDSIARLEAFKSQTTSAQTALSGDLDALKRTIANDIRPKQAQAEAEIAKQVEALNKTKNELAGVKSAQATYEETTTRRLAELTNLANGKASKSELTQTAEELASKIASVQVGGRNYIRGTRRMALASGLWTSGTFRPSGVGTTKTINVSDSPATGFDKAIRLTSSDARYQIGIAQDEFEIMPGTYTMSVWVKGSVGQRVRLQTYWAPDDATGISPYFILKDDKWTYLTFSSERKKAGKLSIGYVYLLGADAGEYLDVLAPQLENGTLATSPKEAPEDTDGQISAVESTFKQRADSLDAGVRSLTEGLRTKADISSLNVTAENIRQSVKSLETDTQNKLNQKLSQAEFEVQAGSIRQEILNATKDKADKTLVVAEAGKLREEFSKMKVGSRNYAEDYDFSRGLWYYTQGDNSPQDWTISNGEYNVKGTTNTWKQMQIYSKEGSITSGKSSTALLDLEIGETYTLSFQGICYSGSSSVWLSLRANRTVSDNPEIMHGNFNLTSNWQTYQVTIPALTKPENFDFWRIILGYNEVGHVAFRKVELTRSSTRIDAGPAPEDGKTDLIAAKSEFEKTAEGLSMKLAAVESYVGQDSQRQEALQRYTREESARQATAVREQISRDYVGKSAYQEDVRGLERRFSAISTQTSNDIASKIAQYKQTVDGQFSSITSQIAGKANQTDFQRVRETSQLYERIIGSNENDISNKVARMALTNQLFQVEVSKNEGLKTVQRQLAGSWAVQNINSAGDIISGINLGANGHNRFVGKLTHITGETLIDNAVIKSAMVDKLKTANFEAGSVTTTILDAEAVTAEKLKVDNALIRKITANEAFIDQLTSKRIFATRIESVISSSTVLEGYKGWIGGFQLGTHDSGSGRWITGRNHFSVGMGDGEGGSGRTALWVNWGNNWNEPGYYAWFVKNNGKMYCYNTAEFWKTPVINGDLKVTGNIIYDGGAWIYSSQYRKIGRSSTYYFYLEKANRERDYFLVSNDTSDRRLKSNIQESSVSGIDIINRLKTYSYRKEFNNEVEDISCGIMAQDVQKYAPDAFREAPDGVYTYNTFALVPYLIKAIQELNQKIEKMEKTIA